MQPSRSIKLVFVLAGVLATSPTAEAGITEITTCGQTVRGRAVLENDLNCPGSLGVKVEVSGRVDLNGFTISGGHTGIICTWKCKVVGPGVITGNSGAGIAASRGLTLKDVEVRANGSDGTAFGILSKAKITNSTISENGGSGVWMPSRAVVRNSTISGNGGSGISVRFSTSLATGAGGRTFVRGSAISENGAHGVISPRVKTRTSMFDGNALSGIVFSESSKLNRSTISGSGRFGVTDTGWLATDACPGGSDPPEGRIDVSANSLVTGNGGRPECGVTEPCADIASCTTPPRIKATESCGVSYVNDSGLPGANWGVCLAD